MTPSTTRNPRTLITMTGPTATGKSTTARELVIQFANVGVKAVFVDDYYHMWQWVNDRANIDRGLVTWEGDTFMLAKHAYQEISAHVALCLADEAIRLFQSGIDIVIVEAARGAGNPRDTYSRHLFEPILKKFRELIDEISGQPLVFNVETNVSFATARERASRRAESDPTAPPPEILLRYMSELGVNISANNEAQQLGGTIRTMEIDTGVLNPEQVAMRVWKEVMLVERAPLLEAPSRNWKMETDGRPAGSKER